MEEGAFLAQIMASLNAWVKYEWAGREIQAIPHPGTFINQRYFDDIPEPKQSVITNVSAHKPAPKFEKPADPISPEEAKRYMEEIADIMDKGKFGKGMG